MSRAISVMTELDNRQQEVAMGTTLLHPISVTTCIYLNSHLIYIKEILNTIIKVLLIQDTTFNF